MCTDLMRACTHRSRLPRDWRGVWCKPCAIARRWLAADIPWTVYSAAAQSHSWLRHSIMHCECY